MPPLQAALAFAEVDPVAVLVGEDLNLDVARMQDHLLDVDAAVAERGGRLARGSPECRLEVLGRRHPAHTLAAASGDGLQHHRVAELLRPGPGLLGVL